MLNKDQLAHGVYYNGHGAVSRWDNGSQRFYGVDMSVYTYEYFCPEAVWPYDRDTIPFAKIVETDEYKYKKC